MSEFTIGEVSIRSKVSASAIRYYERQGLIAQPARRSGRRRYGTDAIIRLRLIAAARHAGLSIAALRALAKTQYQAARSARIEEEIELVDRQLSQLAQLRALLDRARQCACTVPDRCELLSTIAQA